MTKTTSYTDRRYTVTANGTHITNGDAMAAKAQIFQARSAGMTATPRIFQIGSVRAEWPQACWIELSESALNEAARREEQERYHGAVYAD